MLEQVAWGGCGISTLGGVQDSVGCGPVHPDLIRCALSRGCAFDGLQRSLPT